MANNNTDCCRNLFGGFNFENLKTAKPPKEKGIYVLKVNRKGKPIGEIVEQAKRFVEQLNWPMVGDFIRRRIMRLEKIEQCPVIYIGSAGAKKPNRGNLSGRYNMFAGRHTAMYPICALLYLDWDLEYGWIQDEHPDEAEKKLKQKYQERHEGKLPPLVDR